MCGIVGILYRQGVGPIGRDLIQMLDGCQHRGPDSTGVALFGEGRAGALVLWIRAPAGNGAPHVLREQVEGRGGRVLDLQAYEGFLRAVLEYPGEPRELSERLEEGAGLELFSLGRRLEVIKDLGSARSIDARYGISPRQGTHGIGHVRLATESRVDISRSHPFWARGFSDIAIVHNGQLTNYHKLKRRLERQGYRFQTDNDSELIALYVADQLFRGLPLIGALEQAISELDGTFSFLVATAQEIGFAKDRLGAKPMVVLERDGLVAIASEEAALQRLFPEEDLSTYEPLPATVNVWLN